MPGGGVDEPPPPLLCPKSGYYNVYVGVSGLIGRVAGWIYTLTFSLFVDQEALCHSH